MKKHASIFLFLAFALCLTSCKTHKNTQRNSTLNSKVENIATSIDKSLKTKETGSNVSVSATQAMWELTQRLEFDTLGNVRAVQETRRGSGRTELAIRNDSSRDISLNNAAEVNKTTAKTDSTGSQKSDLKSDSRPIQGTEWLWIAIVAGIIIIVLILIYVPRHNS